LREGGAEAVAKRSEDGNNTNTYEESGSFQIGHTIAETHVEDSL
jgi:hypothetical protein